MHGAGEWGPILSICGKKLEVDFILVDQEEQALPSPVLRMDLALSSISLLFIIGPCL